MRTPFLIGCCALLAACQPAADQATDAKEDAAQEATSSGARAPAAEPPPAYIGTWVADLSWCQNTVGPERPIEVTATEFRGYENTCQIVDVAQSADGWEATFNCQAEGQASTHPVGIEADGNRLEISWRNEGYSVEWRRCPA